MAPREMKHPGDELATPAVARRLDLSASSISRPARPQAPAAAQPAAAAPPSSPPRDAVRNPRSGRRRFVEVSPGTNRSLRQQAPRGRPAPPTARRDTPPVPRHEAKPHATAEREEGVQARGGVRMLLSMQHSDSKCSPEAEAAEGKTCGHAASDRRPAVLAGGADSKCAEGDDEFSPLVFEEQGLSPASGASRSPTASTPGAEWHGMPPSSVARGGHSTLHSSGYMSTGGFSSMGSTAASHASASPEAELSPESSDTRATPVAVDRCRGGVRPRGWAADDDTTHQSLTLQGTMRLQGKVYGNPGQLSRQPVRLAAAEHAPGLSLRPRLGPIAGGAPSLAQYKPLGTLGAPAGRSSSVVPRLPLPATPNGSPGLHGLETAADRTPAVTGSSQHTDQEVQRAIELITAGRCEKVKALVKGGALAAGVNGATARGETLLMAACRAGRSDLAKWLVMHGGAAVNQQDSEGNTALHSCMRVGAAGSSPGPMGGRASAYGGAGAISSEGVRLARWMESMGGDMMLANDFGQTPVSLL